MGRRVQGNKNADHGDHGLPGLRLVPWPERGNCETSKVGKAGMFGGPVALSGPPRPVPKQCALPPTSSRY